MIHYPIAPHKQKAYTELGNQVYPITEKIHREVLSLPINSALNETVLKEIVERINSFQLLTIFDLSSDI